MRAHTHTHTAAHLSIAISYNSTPMARESDPKSDLTPNLRKYPCLVVHICGVDAIFHSIQEPRGKDDHVNAWIGRIGCPQQAVDQQNTSHLMSTGLPAKTVWNDKDVLGISAVGQAATHTLSHLVS